MDTQRACDVELDELQQRASALPSSSQKDNFVKKQKLDQKSQRRGKPIKSRKEQEAEQAPPGDGASARRLEIKIPDEITVGEWLPAWEAPGR